MTTYLACEPFMTVEEVLLSGACSDCVDESVPEEEAQVWIDQASDIVAILTGMRVFGTCTYVARPCRQGGRCWCDCCHLDAIPLGDPKPTIEEVILDGLVLDPEEYDLHWNLNGWNLVRLGDGSGPPPAWPSHQKRYLPDTEEDTFAIYMTLGIPTNIPLVKAAVLELVCDLASTSQGGYQNVNQLESGVIQAQLGGTTLQVDPDRLARLQAGEAGPALTTLIGIYAPQGRQQSVVYAPELHDCWDINLRMPTVVAS